MLSVASGGRGHPPFILFLPWALQSLGVKGEKFDLTVTE